jgi:Fe-S-cluster containining protein
MKKDDESLIYSMGIRLMSDISAGGATQIRADSPSEEAREEQDLYDGIEYKVRAFVGPMVRQGQTMACVDEVYAFTDQLIEQLNSGQLPPIQVACQAGCSWCCHLYVEVTPLEVLRIVSFLRETFDAAELNAVISKVISMDEQKKAAAVSDSDTRIPCAFLVDGLCSVYSVRPLKCRGGNSTDAETCEAYFNSGEDGLLTISAPQLLGADSVQNGLARGSSAGGDRSERLELSDALRVALEHPDVMEDCIEGVQVFSEVRS